jgi:hypothetical protein
VGAGVPIHRQNRRRSKIVRSACFCVRRPNQGRRSLVESCICPRHGPQRRGPHRPRGTARRRKAGVSGEVEFATKPKLARQMLEHTFAEGDPQRWAEGDSVYDASRRLWRWLEERRQPFILAVLSNESLWARPIWEDGQAQTAAEIVDGPVRGAVPESFQRLLAGKGSKGERPCGWALIPPRRPQLTDEERAWSHARFWFDGRPRILKRRPTTSSSRPDR